MALTLDDLFRSPDHYLFLLEGDEAVFRPMDAAAYRQSIFLDRRIEAAGQGAMKVPLRALMTPREAMPTGNMHWIFHIAHCGSTLLARGLDQGSALVLREPLTLRQMAVEHAQAFAGGVGNDDWRSGLKLILAMLGKRYAADAPLVIKANVPVNMILPEIAAAQPEAPALFLHFPLTHYLAAILRSPNHRAWAAHVVREIGPALEHLVGPVSGLSEAEVAAALWLAQMRAFDRAMRLWQNAVSLSADRLFDDMAPTLAAALAWSGQTVDGDAISAIAQALGGRYAKNPDAAFDNAARLTRREETLSTFDDEIRAARQWVDARLADHPLPDALPRPLIGDPVPLLD